MRIKILIITLLALFGSNVIAEELTIPEEKDVIQFETRIGIVTFLVKPCHECHQHKSKVPSKTKTAFHDRCTGCHEYTVAGGQHAGPLKKKCKLCHVKPPKN
jgi:hypothetical protein